MLKTGRVYDKPVHRSTFEGILYRMRVGCPWRDVPEAFGDWSAFTVGFICGVLGIFPSKKT